VLRAKQPFKLSPTVLSMAENQFISRAMIRVVRTDMVEHSGRSRSYRQKVYVEHCYSICVV